MLEYVFFHRQPLALFVELLRTRQVAYETDCDDEVLQVRIADDLDEQLVDELETRYDELMELNQQLVDQAQGAGKDNYEGAGVVLTLANGDTSYAYIDPELLGRIMKVLSPRELGVVVNAIVDAVESPDPRSYCQRVRDGDVDPGEA